MTDKEAFDLYMRHREMRISSAKWDRHYAKLMLVQLKHNGFRVLKAKNGGVPKLVREVWG